MMALGFFLFCEANSYSQHTHVVKENETLLSISRRYQVSPSSILSANPNMNPDEIQLGDQIKVPKAKMTYLVRNGDTLWSIARKYSLTPERIQKANRLSEDKKLNIGDRIFIPLEQDSLTEDYSSSNSEKLIWPMKGVLSKSYTVDNKLYSHGICIDSSVKNVLATGKGKVIFVDVLRGYGLTIMIKHSSGLITVYSSRESQALVEVGSQVEKGSIIAKREDGKNQTRLFFQVWRDDRNQNPLNFLK